MKRIASRQNPVFKALLRMAIDSGARRDEHLAVIEGIHLGCAYLDSGGVPRQVAVAYSSLDHPEVSGLLARTDRADQYVFDDALFASLTSLGRGAAVLMVIEPPDRQAPASVTRTAVLLDRVQDPGNVGSIMRSAAAAGIADVFLSAGCAGAWSPKVVRAGMGAHFHLRVHEEVGLAALRAQSTLPWIATSPHATRSIYDADLRGEVAWVFGHEGQGLEAALIDEASAVRIPQPGAMESLNVAASAAICFFEQVRQRGLTIDPDH